MPRQTTSKQNTAVSSAKSRAKIKGRALLIFYSTVLLCVIIGGILLCIFVFFKVSDININGSTIYSQEEIVSAIGIGKGDNLVFAKTTEAEDSLKSQFPYIDNVKISKKIPSTIQVDITEAEVYYSFSYGGRYVYVSRTGKMLESQDAPMAGSILVTGGEVNDEGGKIRFNDLQMNEAFMEISNLFLEHEKGDITEIDLSNVHDIYVIYDGRVKLKLGNASDLTYKLNFGLQIVNNSGIKEDETGTLDLSMSKSVNKAYFTPEAITPDSGVPPTAEVTPPENATGDGTEPETVNSEPAAESPTAPPEDNSSQSGTDSTGEASRGSDIPDV